MPIWWCLIVGKLFSYVKLPPCWLLKKFLVSQGKGGDPTNSKDPAQLNVDRWMPGFIMQSKREGAEKRRYA